MKRMWILTSVFLVIFYTASAHAGFSILFKNTSDKPLENTLLCFDRHFEADQGKLFFLDQGELKSGTEQFINEGYSGKAYEIKAQWVTRFTFPVIFHAHYSMFSFLLLETPITERRFFLPNLIGEVCRRTSSFFKVLPDEGGLFNC